MELLQTILITLLTLGILVTIHEFGHFIVARRCGVKVLRFSVGFGRPLFSWYDKQGTEYAIAAIPLGGYVKMVDEREGEVPADQLPYAFNRKSVGARTAIVSAGPLANLLLAVVAFWVLYVGGVSDVVPLVQKVEPGSVAERAGIAPDHEIVAIDGEPTPTVQAVAQALLEHLGETGPIEFSVRYKGSDAVQHLRGDLHEWLSDQEEPDLMRGIGIQFWRPPVEAVVGDVVSGSPAAKAGLQVGDRIVGADGAAVADWEAWVSYVRARPDVQISVDVDRDGKTLNLRMTPERKVDNQGKPFGLVGIGVKPPEIPPEMLRKQHFNVFTAVVPALQQTWKTTVFTLDSMKKMVLGLISHKNLSGPITIAKVATASAKVGWESYIGFLALLSISLGVLNLLPVPVLDGGHLLFYAFEAILGKPLPEKIQNFGTQIGLSLVLLLMMLALFNDFSRL